MAYMVIWPNPTMHAGLHAAMQEQHVPALTHHSPWSPIWAEWNSQVTSWSCTLFHLSLFYSLSHTLMHTHTAPSSSFSCSFPPLPTSLWLLTHSHSSGLCRWTLHAPASVSLSLSFSRALPHHLILSPSLSPAVTFQLSKAGFNFLSPREQEGREN